MTDSLHTITNKIIEKNPYDYKDMDKDVASIVYLKALSANWKYVKKNLSHPYMSADFFRYVHAKIVKPQPDFSFLEQLEYRFLSLSNVLRSKV